MSVARFRGRWRQVVADAVQFLGKPTKSGSPDGGVAEPDGKPADRPALGKYRKAS